MIQRIQIKNFKCYGDPGADFTLKRINFIFGDNSAGKSTFLQLLRMVCNGESNEIRKRFKDYVFSGDTSREVKLRVTASTDTGSRFPVYEYAINELTESKTHFNTNKSNFLYLGFVDKEQGGTRIRAPHDKDDEQMRKIHNGLKDPYANGVPKMIHLEAARPIHPNGNETKKTSLDETLMLATEAIEYLNVFFKILNVPYAARNRNELTDKVFGQNVNRKNVGAGIDGLFETGLKLCDWKMGKQKLLAIEEPESHVNERQLAPMTEFIVREALSDNSRQCIIECHSELMILKVMQIVKKRTLSLNPKDIGILYATKTPEGTVISECPITDNGDVLDWPDKNGFFSERDNVIFG